MLLKISQYSQEKPVPDSFFNKAARPQGCNFIKKRVQRKCFPVNAVKFLKKNFFHRTPPVAASE